MVNGARKSVRRQPFRERIGFKERAIDFLGAGRQNAVETYGIGHVLPHEFPDWCSEDERGLANPTRDFRFFWKALETCFGSKALSEARPVSRPFDPCRSACRRRVSDHPVR